ncbi:MAG: hypothetical protein OXC55_08970 [Chloroflexi bacterium]|nr:hypothetical protein [Chloroflexota bacterium]
MTTTIELIDERPMAALEPLVDRVIAAIFGRNAEKRESLSIARAIHEARRLRREGKPEEALATFSAADARDAALEQKRWLYNEWFDLVRRCFGRQRVVVYTQGDGRAAALEQVARGDLEVVAVLSMKWRPGKVVSRRSLRGLRALNGRPA